MLNPRNRKSGYPANNMKVGQPTNTNFIEVWNTIND